MLFAGSNDTLSAFGNWIHHTSGRGPHAGGLEMENVTAHFVNDYFETVPGHAADASIKANLVFEGSAFENVTTPFAANYMGGNYAPLSGTLASTSSACMAALGRACVANTVQPAVTFPLDAPALQALQAHPGSQLHPFPAAEVPFVVPHLAGPGHL